MAVSSDMRDVASLPLPPLNPLPYKERLAACRSFHTGTDILRDAGGPVTRFRLAPRWLMPPLVVVTSPQGIRDVVSCRDSSIDKTAGVTVEMQRLLGPNLFVTPFEQWKPRRRTLQPVFTKQSVNTFGGHMSKATESVCGAWQDGSEIDLDVEARKLTMRALGHSVLGLDVTSNNDSLSAPMREAVSYAVSRAISPVRAPMAPDARTSAGTQSGSHFAHGGPRHRPSVQGRSGPKRTAGAAAHRGQGSGYRKASDGQRDC